MQPEISSLRDRPEFFDTVADRIWQAWWKPHGIPLDDITSRLKDALAPGQLPLALVAHDDAKFLGTASVISSDLDERPQYTPWVAAVWIDPDFRRLRLGERLVGQAAQAIFAAGFARAYLCARPLRRSYYERLGWTPIEDDVGQLNLTVFTLSAATGGGS